MSSGFNESYLPIDTGSETFLVGDANGDDEVTVADIVEIVNYLEGNPSSQFNEKNADANGIDGVTIEDINAIVNIIFGE